MSKCSYCFQLLHPRKTLCPHCYRQNEAPNVRLARQDVELSELDSRYKETIDQAPAKTINWIKNFEAVISSNQKVAIARSAQQIMDFLSTPGALYQTYHQQVLSDRRYPGSGATDRVRIQFENAALPELADIVVFGSLSIADRGVPHFGTTAMILSPTSCQPRTTFFYGNPLKISNDLDMKLAEPFPPGYRSVWEDAFKLAVVKHAKNLDGSQVNLNQWHDLIITPALKDEDDEDQNIDYIEAHIFEGFTATAISKLVFMSSAASSETEHMAWAIIKEMVKTSHPHIDCEEI